ncbi:MASE3 domain-containing protein [Halanaerobacter jeridensis]|uniref:Serine phosphatase RsbU (Regulator of sigma subunit) n=1 Tax=Halanaerobacter jeridensis TaxID=706427 RepID=A0A939BRI4_9FIRM|nr:MASE3 domain-containing protein [Halanaerobacter jeridensis]MBM7557379.1 serine phosphatase RsbU (regulator of sigma subunit) [Halanaerobacter jeridensis]
MDHTLFKDKGFKVFLLLTTMLLFLEFKNFLLFHLGVELFSIIIAFSIFIIVININEITDNDYLIFLGLAYGFIAGFDLLHTLSYKGMSVLDVETNIPTQLWIAARYFESFILIGSFYYLDHKLNKKKTIILFSLISALIIVSIFMGYFPDCFIAGQGLTSFKIISEYIIIALLIIALFLLYYYQDRFTKKSHLFLKLALFTTIAAEFFFTLYIDVFGLSNVIGHLFKLMSFYFLYRSVIKVVLQDPYTSLFYKLKNKNENLQESYEEIDSINEELKAMQSELKSTNQQLRQRIEAGRKIHLQLMGDKPKDLKELSLAASYLPAEEIGGDLYNLIKLEDKFIFYLVDITGHGIDGAFLNVFVKEAINNFLVTNDHRKDLSPQEIMEHINQRFREEQFPEDYFICLLLFIVDLDDYRVKYANAGFQTLPLLVKNGKVKELTATELPISLAIPSTKYEFPEDDFYLEQQDIILAATDGLIEERARGGIYGAKRLINNLKLNYHSSPQFIMDQIIADFKQFIEKPQSDDITLLVLKRDEVNSE